MRFAETATNSPCATNARTFAGLILRARAVSSGMFDGSFLVPDEGPAGCYDILDPLQTTHYRFVGPRHLKFLDSHSIGVFSDLDHDIKKL